MKKKRWREKMISNIDTQQMDVLKGYLDPPIIELTA